MKAKSLSRASAAASGPTTVFVTWKVPGALAMSAVLLRVTLVDTRSPMVRVLVSVLPTAKTGLPQAYPEGAGDAWPVSSDRVTTVPLGKVPWKVLVLPILMLRTAVPERPSALSVPGACQPV